jgi:hypothetical protein
MKDENSYFALLPTPVKKPWAQSLGWQVQTFFAWSLRSRKKSAPDRTPSWEILMTHAVIFISRNWDIEFSWVISSYKVLSDFHCP